jgi:hypothetical protein
MIGRLLASAAFAVALGSAALIGTAAAQMAAPPPANPSASPSANEASPATGAPMTMSPSQPAMSKPMKSQQSQHSAAGSGMTTKQTAQGHEQSGVADKLNACENKPLAERQPCIDAATRM